MANTSGYIITTAQSASKEYDNSISSDLQAPFSLGPFGPINLRQKCKPYYASSNPEAIGKVEGCDFIPPPAQTISLPVIASSIEAYAPTLARERIWWSDVLSVSNSLGSASMHVGSLWLDARTYSKIGVLANELKFGGGGKNVYIQFKRATDGDTSFMGEMYAEGAATYQDLTRQNVTVATSGWYDIYMSSSFDPDWEVYTTSSIRGVYYEY